VGEAGASLAPEDALAELMVRFAGEVKEQEQWVLIESAGQGCRVGLPRARNEGAGQGSRGERRSRELAKDAGGGHRVYQRGGRDILSVRR